MRRAMMIATLAAGVAFAAATSMNTFLDAAPPFASTPAGSALRADPAALRDLLPIGTLAGTAADCAVVTNSAGSPDLAPGDQRCGLPSNVTLGDRVYFGAYWQILDRTPATRTIALGGNFANARVERTSEGDFFAGVVEKSDGQGNVTDVILTFAGAHGLDAVQGESVLIGVPLDESARAAALYDQLMSNVRYAHARIHVTGHSLGAGYTQFVLAHSLAKYGSAETDRRADFLAFGAPNWAGSAARHFGVSSDLVAARMVDFTAANDPVLINGVERIGINNYLPAFWGLAGADAAYNVIAAHWPTTYAAALGLPNWLSPTEQAAATAAVSAQFNTGNSIDSAYGPAGGLPLTVNGSPLREWLQGMAGPDRLFGGAGADILTGGAGADQFVYRDARDSGPAIETADFISDFAPGEGDRIDLTAFARPLTARLRFAGIGVHIGGPEIRYAFRGNETVVSIDLDGNGAADLIIRLAGRIALRAADFMI